MFRGERARRIGFPLALASLLLVLDLGLVQKLPCLSVATWEDGRQYRAFCYSDIVTLYHGEGLDAGKVPYVEARNEYPVGTGLFMWVASLPFRGLGPFFMVNAFLLGLLAVFTAFLLYREAGTGVLYFTLAPTLLLCAFLNWDLLPVALATAGIVAYLSDRDGVSGLLLGLGAAAKIFPGLLVLPLALGRWREGRREGAWKLIAWAAGTWVAVNLPFALGSFDRWSFFFRNSSLRPPSAGTVWFLVCDTLTRDAGCGHVPLINALSLASFVAISIVLYRLRLTRDPRFPRWTFGFAVLLVFLLTNKVFSPQYSLWLLPWFALVLPDLRLFVAFELADLAVFFTEFSFTGYRAGYGGLPAWPLEVAVLARAALLVWCLVRFVRGVAVVDRVVVSPVYAPGG